jgi:predicted deacylase
MYHVQFDLGVKNDAKTYYLGATVHGEELESIF